MEQVEILTIQESLILRGSGSELLILPNHVSELKKKQSPRDFTAYFMSESLVNRSARKLFEAWLRKDQGLWQRIYKSVQTIEVSEETLKSIKDMQSGNKTVVSQPKDAVETKSAPKKTAKAEPEEKKASAKSPKAEVKAEKKSPAKSSGKTAAKPTAKKKSK